MVALFLFMFVAIAASALAARTRSQTEAARREARTTAELYAFSRKIAGVIELYDLLWIVVTHLARLLNAEVVMLMPEKDPGDGQLAPRAAFPPDSEFSDADLAAARWSWDADHPTGKGTDTLPGARWLFVPIRTSRSPVGVIGVLPLKAGRELGASERRLLEAVGNQAAIAIERLTLADDIDQARLGAERERLRSAMLTSVSHDLRTPLASIIGALSSLRSYRDRYDAETRDELLGTALSEAERLDRFVGNLLDMTRLDAGAIVPKREAVDVGDLVSTALRRAAPILKDKVVASTWCRPACRRCRSISCWPSRCCSTCWTMPRNIRRPAAASRSRRGRPASGRSRSSCATRGPGIPAEALDRLFDKFYRADAGDRRRAGTGLGLAIAKGFVEAQGGTIAAAQPRSADGRSGAEFIVR